MNRYKKLLSDTAVYGMGTFASKLLVFFLTRLSSCPSWTITPEIWSCAKNVPACGVSMAR